MNIFSRAKNIWRMSEFEPRVLGTSPIPEAKVVQLIKKPKQMARFIPRTPSDPIKELVNEPPK